MDTNASNATVGCVLSRRAKEGREHVIVHISIRFSKEVRHKIGTQLELFAIFTLVRHFGYQASWFACQYEELQQGDLEILIQKKAYV